MKEDKKIPLNLIILRNPVMGGGSPCTGVPRRLRGRRLRASWCSATVLRRRRRGHLRELSAYVGAATADSFAPRADMATPPTAAGGRLGLTRCWVNFVEVANENSDGVKTLWKAQGPQAIGWFCQAHAELNMSPVQRHRWWLRVIQLVTSVPGMGIKTRPRQVRHDFASHCDSCKHWR